MPTQGCMTYCSYDLGFTQNLNSMTSLLEEATEILTCPEDQMPSSQLYITMNVLSRDIADDVADILANIPVVIAVTTLYTDKQSMAGAAVLLPEQGRSM